MDNKPKLSLHIPEPHSRPGEKPDFSSVAIPEAGSVRRPMIGTPSRNFCASSSVNSPVTFTT